MYYILLIIRLIFLIGAKKFARQYIETREKKEVCYIGMGVSIFSIVLSIISMSDCLDTMSMLEERDYYAVGLGREADGIYGMAVLLFLAAIVMTILAIWAIRKYYLALKFVPVDDIETEEPKNFGDNGCF